MPVHDRVASTLSLARGWRQSLDERSAETKIPTATLILLLDTFIEVGSPKAGNATQDGAERTVMAHMSRFEST